MESDILLESHNFKGAITNGQDRSDTESGIGSCPSDEDLHLSVAMAPCIVSQACKPRRRVQFQSAENLVLIREIPPRGFFGSDVSDTDSGAEDEDDDEDADDGDDSDNAAEETKQEASDESEESSSSSESDDEESAEKPRKILIRTPVQSGSYSVGEASGKSTDKISKITSMSMSIVPANIKTPKAKTAGNIEKKSPPAPRKQRHKKIGNSSSEHKSHRVIVADGKKRKNSAKGSSLMQSTSSSRNKENSRKTSHLSHSAPPTPKLQAWTRSKSMSRISIDSSVISNNKPKSALSRKPDFTRPSSAVTNKNRPRSAITSLGHNSVFMTSSAVNDHHSGQLPTIGDTRGTLKLFPRHKQYNAWQVANGNLDGKQVHTPSIAPMWENVHVLSALKIKSKT